MTSPRVERGSAPQWADLLAQATAAAEDVDAALAVASRLGALLPLPGSGNTAVRWRLLADVAARDLTVARVLEAHSDALAILAEAGSSTPADCADRTWGVFAAEAEHVGVEAGVQASGGDHEDLGVARTPAAPRWQLTGTKPWCSLAGVLDYALVTAHVPGGRRLFAVDLRTDAVRADPPSVWAARGLRSVVSGAVHFDRAPATPVGGTDWYLVRPGFAWGGMGVAACWLGAAEALGGSVRRAVAAGGGDILAMHLGAIDVAVHSARTVLMAAADQVDAGAAAGRAGEVLALRVRSVVAAAAEEVLTRAGHALGPAPLAFDVEHARRVADLQIYVRQHHAERDLATLGALLGRPPQTHRPQPHRPRAASQDHRPRADSQDRKYQQAVPGS